MMVFFFKMLDDLNQDHGKQCATSVQIWYSFNGEVVMEM